jgi:hypothetical protein
MILKIFSPKKRKNVALFVKKIITLCLDKRQYFRRKLAKIAENCDHNIDSRSDLSFTTNLKRFLPHFGKKWQFSLYEKLQLFLVGKLALYFESNDSPRFWRKYVQNNNIGPGD